MEDFRIYTNIGKTIINLAVNLLIDFIGYIELSIAYSITSYAIEKINRNEVLENCNFYISCNLEVNN